MRHYKVTFRDVNNRVIATALVKCATVVMASSRAADIIQDADDNGYLVLAEARFLTVELVS